MPNKNKDWVGYRLKCTEVFIIQHEGKKTFDEIKIKGATEITKVFTASGERNAKDIALARLGNLNE